MEYRNNRGADFPLMSRVGILTAVLALPALAAATAVDRVPPKPPAKLSPGAAEFFETHVRPVLAEKCFRCHGPKKRKGDLRLDSRPALLEGGESGPAVVPGNPNRSILIRAIRREGAVKMPPKGKLPAKTIEALTTWVKMGAPWPSDRPLVHKSHKITTAASWKTHWAFQPVRRPAVPAVKQADWCLTPIDCFILARLEKTGLAPARPADRRTLLRRATYDLLGLPPTGEEVAAFEADRSPDAFARVVDRLLSSPRYGERWGRFWLDVARYADTKGYVFTQERRYAYAYTYRDYVIRALNDDLPYDRFLVEQLAADRLPPSKDNRALAALGFLTVGRRFLNNVHDIIDDRIDVVCRGTLGLTVACARCHDHKFDPIPTCDYYSLYGVFASSVEPPDLPVIGSPDQTPAFRAFQEGLRVRQEKLQQYANRVRDELTAQLRARIPAYLVAAAIMRRLPARADRRQLLAAGDLRFPVLRRWQEYLDRARQRHDAVFAPWRAFAALKPEEFAAKAPRLANCFAANADRKAPLNPLVAQLFGRKPPASLRQVADRYGELFNRVDKVWQKIVTLASVQHKPAPRDLADQNEEALRQVLYGPNAPVDVPPQQLARSVNGAVRNKLVDLRREVDAWKATAPGSPPRAMVLRDLPQPITPHVFRRGNPNNPGQPVPRHFLSLFAGAKPRPFTHGSGRLELARSIADPKNPLTARVMVNRIWLHHFGAGLVRTPSDFGMRSEPPTHPELLDYLAARFTADGSSLKKLHRLILLSRVYQQDSEDRPTGRERDPENRLLWKMNRRRLDFEALRDSLLAVTGKLDPAMGGRSVPLTKPPFSTRRTVYGFIDRQNLPGVFRTFDFASPDATNPQRHETTVPQQALFLLNSPFVVELARALVGRPEWAALRTPEQRVAWLYQRVYARSPEVDEVKLALRFLEIARRGPGLSRLTPWEKYAQVLLLANEFMFVD
jgi:hypothetical protein